MFLFENMSVWIVSGRNRKHQGLDVAILKLWEKCEIAKIGVKKGVHNTNTELMAKELQVYVNWNRYQY